jgi:hypothetical protein
LQSTHFISALNDEPLANFFQGGHSSRQQQIKDRRARGKEAGSKDTNAIMIVFTISAQAIDFRRLISHYSPIIILLTEIEEASSGQVSGLQRH